MRVVTPVDVPGGDLGPGEVAGVDRQRTLVEGPPGDAVDGSGQPAVQLDDLTPAHNRVYGIGRGLAVHAQIGVGHLDHTVRLAGHDERVVGQTDVEGLAAPPQRQQQAIRGGADRRRNGQRTLEGSHGPQEGGERFFASGQVGGTQPGHDLGVGGDLVDDREALGGGQVGVIVDVAVLDGGDDRCPTVVGPRRLERVSVGFGDDAHAGPAGVAEHRPLDVGRGEGSGQVVVVPQGRTQGRGVVAQFPDLGGHLGYDGQPSVGQSTRRPRPVQRVVAVHGVDAMAPQRDLQAGRVATPNLQSVDRREGLLDRQQHRQPGRTRRVGDRRQIPHAAARAEPVPGDGPGGVADPRQVGIAGFGVARTGVQRRLDGSEASDELGHAVVDGGGQVGMLEQGTQARDPAQEPVGRFEQLGHIVQHGRVGGRHQADGLGDRVHDLRGGRRHPRGRATQDRDDAAHVALPFCRCRPVAGSPAGVEL